MRLKTLVIKHGDGTIIREIVFGTGLNIVVDETIDDDIRKITISKLIDYCLGAKKQIIWKDEVNKDFLVQMNVYVVLTLVSSDTEHVLERNFRFNKESDIRVDGKKVKLGEYETILAKMILPNHLSHKPPFRRVIAHNIRHDDTRESNNLRLLGDNVTRPEYEALFLYLLGLECNEAYDKQTIEQELNDEVNFCKKLEQGHTLSEYKTTLSYTQSEIQELQKLKELLGFNEDLEKDLQSLNEIKAEIGRVSSELTRQNLKLQIINESLASLDANMESIDTNNVRHLYQEAKEHVSDITTSFDELLQYHNHITHHKKEYIQGELPQVNNKIQELKDRLDELRLLEDAFFRRITKKNSLEELERVVSLLQVHSSKRDELEALINQIIKSQNSIKEHEDRLKDIHAHLYSKEFHARLQERIDSFNTFFQRVSDELYGEAYSLSFQISEDKNGKRSYEFNVFNANANTFDKQGEILCFDLAYQLFKREYQIEGLDFQLNDKRKLMLGSQLTTIAKYVRKNHIQLVVSVPKDKLPTDIERYSKVILTPSQDV